MQNVRNAQLSNTELARGRSQAEGILQNITQCRAASVNLKSDGCNGTIGEVRRGEVMGGEGRGEEAREVRRGEVRRGEVR